MGTLCGANFSKFKIRMYSRKRKSSETVFVCSYGAQVEPFKQKIIAKNLVTLPLKTKILWRNVNQNFECGSAGT